MTVKTTSDQKMQAFDSAKKFGEMFPGLLETLQEWATIGSMQKAGEEIRTNLEAQAAAAKSALAQAKLELESVHKSTAEKIKAEQDAAAVDMAKKRAAFLLL